MNISVENVNFDGYYCYINTSTGYESKNHSYIDHKNKIDGIYTNKYIMDYMMV